MKKIIKYVMTDILQNRIVFVYTVFLLVTSFSVFSLEDSNSKGLLSLLNIILLIVPLVSIIFSTIYVYNSAEFIELLLIDGAWSINHHIASAVVFRECDEVTDAFCTTK